MSNQLYTDGDVINANGQELECTAVTYQEADGERHTFSYTFRLKSELDAEREEQQRREDELTKGEEGVDQDGK